MADNVTADPGTGGAVFATDDIGGVHFPRTKIVIGDNNTNDGDVSAANPLPVDGSGVTQPVSAASLPLPTGAATSAKQDTGNTSLASIDGKITAVNTGAVVVSSSALPTGAATAAKQPGIGTAGSSHADVLSVQGIASGTALPVSVASIPSHAVTNAGTFAVQVDGNALTALQLIDDPVVQDDAAFTPGTTKVTMAGFEADESSTDSVDEGDGGAARMTLDRKVIVTAQPHTTGGLSIFRSLDLDETEEQVKATAGQVYGGWVSNLATSTRFLKFYNDTAANVSVGTTTPLITVPLPGNSSDDITGILSIGGLGATFDTAITVAATTGLADADTGAPGANEVVVNIFYK